MQIFRKLKWFFMAEKKRYGIGVLALVLVALFQLIPPRVIGIVIDEIAGGVLSLKTLAKWSALLIFAAVMQYFFRYLWRTNIWGGAAKLERLLRSRLFTHYTQMDRKFYQKHRTGDLMAHATNDLNAIQNVAGSGILSIADAIITGGSTIIAMILLIDWRLTLLAIIPLPFLALVASILGNKIHEGYREYQESYSDLNDKVQESVTGIKVIKTFGQEAEDIAEFDEKVEKSIKKGLRINRLDALFDPLITIIIGGSYVFTILYGGSLVMEQAISLGQLVSFISYIGMLVWPMFAIGQLFNILERGSASYDRIWEILQAKSSITEPDDAVKKPAAGDIEYAVAKFSYEEDGKNKALENIYFHLPKGKTLGIVGKTGAGKTTIIKLLLREFDHYQGEILFGETDIRQYALDALLPEIGYVPQDHFLFSMTVKDNIRFGKPEASLEEVVEAAKLTAIHDDILEFTKGYDTMVGERGVSLSGGQKQRISIARSLMTQPELLILDDALSAVDAKTEVKILEQLKTLRQGQTTIITAHRLSSVQHADEIIVMDEGKISQRGTHQELVAEAGWYREMYWRQQLEKKLDMEGENA